MKIILVVQLLMMLLLSNHSYATTKKADASFQTFVTAGPYQYTEEQDFRIRVSKNELIKTDLFLVKSRKKLPLLIFQHGNKAHKGVHLNQARRAASWGFNVLTVEQPNVKRWLTNGRVLGELTELIYEWPKMIGKSFDKDNIILIGHSFGGSAVSIAAGAGAPVKGVILLDPALVSPKVIPYLQKVKSNVVLLGADTEIFKSRRRPIFYKNIKTRMVELSVKGATHNDAQSPNLFSLKQTVGLEHGTDSDRQNIFISALITAAYSMTRTADLSFFYHEMKQERRKGVLSFLRHK